MWIGLRSQSYLRFGFDSDSRPSSSALPLQAPTGEEEGAGSGESLLVHNCSCCGVAYDGLKAVTHHAEAKKRKECESAAAMSHRMKSFFTPKGSAQSEKVGIAELTEVYHSIKRHISYVAHDCSLKVLKQVINDSDIVKQMTGGRTKCTALVNQVLFPYSMELVQEDLKNYVPFSVANDASNKGNRKFFPVAIQYFSPKSGICHKILDFYEDSFEDSTSIKERLCEVMNKSRLPWSRVTAYGADNASINFGVNNSVFQKLKSEENNDIIAAHCNDHIFHNCAKNALKVMPVDVENIVMKVFAEFSCSAKKREDLKECFDFFESEYREVIRHVSTRWLSLFKALDRMLSSWGPLKSCLNLECGRLPTLDQLLELLSISPWKQQTPPEQIYDELAALLSIFPSLKLEGNSIEMWCNFFQKEEALNLLKIVQFVCSVPVSNAFVERIFSVMGNVWTDERNRVAVNTVKSELCIFFNISSSCTEFKDAISTNKPLLKAVSSNAKYTKK
ncbi:dimer_Tnp_hAT domain-containing protein [Trichonephila clavipes]|nr:dimer_Tnp_hAT domain-containing protein [Trichonephila clavipes]